MASKQQVIHGVFLIVVGLAGYLWNAKAISALIAGGLTGGVNLLLFVRMNSGAPWAFKASLYLNIFFLALFGWRAYGAWTGYLQGNEDKLVPAALITLMLTSTAALIPTLLGAAPAVAKKVNTSRKAR